MNKPDLSTSPMHAAAGTRLAQILASSSDTVVTLSHRNFVEKLAKLVDLSEAISMSETLRSLPRLTVSPSVSDAGDLKDAFLALRADRVDFIGRSFVSAGKELPFILPTVRADMLDNPNEAFQAYQRFYSLHQSEMDYQTLAFRTQLRQQLTQQSDRLARLARLDAALSDTLAENHRRVFARVPALLAKRFQLLSAEWLAQGEVGTPDDWLRSHGWLAKFYREMQNLLLAELEVRLLPVLGLIEARDVEELK